MSTLTLFDIQPTVHDRDRRGTPPDLIASVLRLEGADAFDLDVAAEEGMSCAPRFITAEQDALVTEWGPGLLWCNPPFGRGDNKLLWFKRVVQQVAAHGCRAWVLLPAAAGQSWYRWGYDRADVRLVCGPPRVDFRSPTGGTEGSPGPVQPALLRFVPLGYRDHLTGMVHGCWPWSCDSATRGAVAEVVITGSQK